MSHPVPEHAAHNLRRIGQTLRKNRASNATEELARLGAGFCYADHAGEFWQDERLSLLAGTPLWEQSSPTQRRALNHLWWVAFYQLISAAEMHTIEYNQRCAAAFFPLRGYEEVCLELDLETSQERYHIQAFRQVSEATEAALVGQPLFARPEARGPGALKQRVRRGNTGLRDAALRGVGLVHATQVSRSPFLASQYFLLRGLLNLVAKHKEASAFQRFQAASLAGGTAPAPTAIVYYHYIDEGYHTAVSQLLSHEIYRDFAPPSALEVAVMNRFVAAMVRALFSHLGTGFAGSLGDDAEALPMLLALLCGPIFGLERRAAMAALERSYCAEHEGFHVSLAYRERWTGAARQSLADIEYLDPALRELRAAPRTLGEVLARNREAFAAFARRSGTES